MKRLNSFVGTGLAVCVMMFCGIQLNAQENQPLREQGCESQSCDGNEILKKIDFRVDWQVNSPVSTDFADQISGWGMNFELTYQLTPRWEAGLFASFHNNYDYVGRQTLKLSPTESLTTDQTLSLYQLPFGLTTSYALCRNKVFRPYVGLKLGALYSRNKTYTGLDGWYDQTWGFYASPELGVEVFPFRHAGVGFRVSAYYGYGTNQCSHLTGKILGINDVGFRLGIVF